MDTLILLDRTNVDTLEDATLILKDAGILILAEVFLIKQVAPVLTTIPVPMF